MNQTIYLTDDERDICELLASFLTSDGFSVRCLYSGEELLSACEEALPDLVVLDIILPGADGLSVCSTLRRSYPDLPIILISAKDSPYDRVTGLTLGGDDYICKPFLPLELVARVRSLLRRAGKSASSAPKPEQELVFGPLTLHPGRRTATLDGTDFPLTPTEFDFLAYLIPRADQAVSREELLHALWQVDWEADTRATDDLVKRLRRKLRARGSHLQIETVWGFGFRLSLEGVR